MEKDYKKYSAVFKSISDDTRLKILDMLSCGEMCACDILEEFNISQSTLSYHMKILSNSGLINAIKDGSWMKYTLNRENVDNLKDFFDSIIVEEEDCICRKYNKGSICN